MAELFTSQSQTTTSIWESLSSCNTITWGPPDGLISSYLITNPIIWYEALKFSSHSLPWFCSIIYWIEFPDILHAPLSISADGTKLIACESTTDKIYTSSINSINDLEITWAGSPDGLFYSYDDGYSWDMYRSLSFEDAFEDGNKNLSAYPNPFYIDEESNQLRIVYYDELNSHAELDIFDFSMQHVITLTHSEIIGDEAQFIWDGRNKFSQYVSNGIYLCRLTLGGATYWTKLMVVHSWKY